MEDWKLHVINVINVMNVIRSVGRRKLKPRKTRLNVWVFDGICVPLQKESKP